MNIATGSIISVKDGFSQLVRGGILTAAALPQFGIFMFELTASGPAGSQAAEVL